MSFINKSVNYSQTSLLKKTILFPLLSSYNDFLLKERVKTNKFSLETSFNEFIIANNNKKYYLLITHKTLLEPTNLNYNIFYFFPDLFSIQNYLDNKVVSNTLSDFYLETERKFTDAFLFEGYLYKKDSQYNFLITDILCKNDQIVSVDYNLRFTMINELLLNKNLKKLNDHMSISIHPIIQKQNENMIHIFTNNFIYKDELCCIEKVSNFIKERFVKNIKIDEQIKFIEQGKYSDVYNVYNKETNNFEGILYIKGIKESKHMRELLKQKTRISIPCSFNNTFQKWQPTWG